MTDPNVTKGGSSEGTSSSLLERVRAQDRNAWERLVGLYGPLVYRWCRQSGLQLQDAEDVGQEVFAAVYRKVPDFRRDRDGDTFRGWLRVIARNKLRDLARRRRGAGRIGSGGEEPNQKLHQLAADDDVNTDPQIDASERVILVQRAVELIRHEFTEDKWRVFRRVVVEGQRPREVAAAFGMSVNVVYVTKSRVLRRLREEFAGLLEVDEA